MIETQHIEELAYLNSNLYNNKMWTAGILALRNDRLALKYMLAWNLNMKDPRKLMKQVTFNSKVNHRFDQSIFSILVANSTIDCQELSGGFFSLGEESTVDSLKKSWIYTGEISDGKENRVMCLKERNKDRILYYGNKIILVAYHIFI